MLHIKIKTGEVFNEETQTFIDVIANVYMEHSLLTVSKWEEQFEKPFLGSSEKTSEENWAYLEIMCLDEDSRSNLSLFTQKEVNLVQEYIAAKRSATFFNEFRNNEPRSREIITSELIYYWMFSLRIPKECEEWHLNRLMTLIRVFEVKESKQKKISKREIAARNKALNAQRRQQLNTRG